MIAIASPVRRNHFRQGWQRRFVSMLPQIRQSAQLAFQAVRHEAREEFVAEVIANAYCAYLRLVERGKEDVAYPTPLAMFAIRQVRSGRRVGIRGNLRDITSSRARNKASIKIERLDRFGDQQNEWQAVLVEDRRAGPAEIAAARIDVADWLGTLDNKRRQVAEMLASGESTSCVAQAFGLSTGRVSQLRQELKNSWSDFQGGSTAVFA